MKKGYKKKKKKTAKQKLSIIWKIKESKFVFGFEDRNRKAAEVCNNSKSKSWKSNERDT